MVLNALSLLSVLTVAVSEYEGNCSPTASILLLLRGVFNLADCGKIYFQCRPPTKGGCFPVETRSAASSALRKETEQAPSLRAAVSGRARLRPLAMDSRQSGPDADSFRKRCPAGSTISRSDGQGSIQRRYRTAEAWTLIGSLAICSLSLQPSTL